MGKTHTEKSADTTDAQAHPMQDDERHEDPTKGNPLFHEPSSRRNPTSWNEAQDEKTLTAATLSVVFAFLPIAVNAAPVTSGAGAEYGAHISDHAREMRGFSGQMNPGDHSGFAGFDEHHH